MNKREKNSARATIVALATAPGYSGVGVIRLSGPKALSIGQQISKKPLRPREAVFSIFLDSKKEVIDKGVCLFFSSPHSYTGEDTIEFQCHGAPVVLSLLQETCVELGARLARPGEFTERAFINGKIDLYQAETVADLIEARSELSVKSAMRSLQGEFSKKIRELLNNVIDLRVYVESALDFPDEEIDFLADEKLILRLKECYETAKVTLLSAKQGKVINQGLTVAIIGKPNVGKSSLMNALLGEEAAIVTDIPGTTRDRLEYDFLLDGIRIRLIDTAGLRETDDKIEQEGIRRSKQALKMADWVFYIQEAEPAQQTVPFFEKNKPLFVIRNKVDLYNRAAGVTKNDKAIEIMLSAKTCEGIELLKQEMRKQIGIDDLNENVCIARQRHINALKQAVLHITLGLERIEEHAHGELLAQEFRWAQDALSEITGEFHSDDLLGEIFSRFCIGK